MKGLLLTISLMTSLITWPRDLWGQSLDLPSEPPKNYYNPSLLRLEPYPLGRDPRTRVSNFVGDSSSSRNDLIGAGVGAAVGAVLSRSLACSIQDTPCGWQPLALLFGVFVGGLIGAGIGSGL